MTLIHRRTAVALALIAGAAAGARALTPKRRRSDILGPLDLEAAIPRQFADWSVDTNSPSIVVDPQTQQTINATYTKTLSRTYIASRGKRIMLSLAYGAELTDTGVGLHYPEVCYPAQGFKVLSSTPINLRFPTGIIKARRLETQYGDNRFEPVTYWTMIGPHSQYHGLDKKFAEIQLGLMGEKADGLLFRVSNITRDSSFGFTLNDNFVRDLIRTMNPANRSRLTGLS